MPILLLGPGHVPAAAVLELGVVSLAVALFESARGTVLPVAGIFLGQGLVYAGLLWIAASLAVRAAGAWARTLALLAAALLLVAAAALPVYRDPYHATKARVGLLEVYR
jgi:hypothetical protein